jgi:predicted nucleic acid-binding protein
MIVVCDTTPINYLVQIELIDLIPRLYGTAFIPPAVLGELLHPRTPAAVADWASNLPQWVVVKHAVATTPPLAALHRGEQEAIWLAEFLQARILLTDDYRARAAAHTRGIATVTTLLVLDIAADRGWIDFTDAISRLLQTNFRVDRSTIDQLTAKHR